MAIPTQRDERRRTVGSGAGVTQVPTDRRAILNLHTADDAAAFRDGGVVRADGVVLLDLPTWNSGPEVETGIVRFEPIKFRDGLDVDHPIGGESFHTNVVYQVGAAGKDSGMAVMFGNQTECIGQRRRAGVFKVTHNSWRVRPVSRKKNEAE